ASATRSGQPASRDPSTATASLGPGTSSGPSCAGVRRAARTGPWVNGRTGSSRPSRPPPAAGRTSCSAATGAPSASSRTTAPALSAASATSGGAGSPTGSPPSCGQKPARISSASSSTRRGGCQPVGTGTPVGAAAGAAGLGSVVATQDGEQAQHLQVQPDQGDEQAEGRRPRIPLGQAVADPLLDEVEVQHEEQRSQDHAEGAGQDGEQAV